MVKLKNYKYFALIITFFVYGCITKPEESDFALDSVIGRIVDLSSLPVSDAVITVQPGSLTAKTDANGYFEIRNISPGTYNASIVKTTDQEFIKQNIPITVKTNRISDIRISSIAGFIFVDARDSLGYNFYISKYELTYGDYFEGSPNYAAVERKNLPWEGDWENGGYPIQTYLNKKSVAEGLTPCYTITEYTTSVNLNANGYRFPTLKEWMYAAKGGKYSKGYIYAGSNNINEVAWYEGNSGGLPHPVGQKKPNELGIYDMNGNLTELCYGKLIVAPWGTSLNAEYCGGAFSSPASSIGLKSGDSDDMGYRIVRIIK
ncbi:MAG: SUMF1/EgtB/PvdO family nonheme iron enzyme [Ignavibacteriales bacterium]